MGAQMKVLITALIMMELKKLQKYMKVIMNI